MSESMAAIGAREVRKTARDRFASASHEDKRKRTRLYRMGQVRLLIRGRRSVGPVKLLGRTYAFDPEDVDGGYWKSDNFQDSEPVWICEYLFEEKTGPIGEYSLGSELNEMEALAWVSR